MTIDVIRVLVIDDHQLMIDGIKSILEGEQDVVFAGGVANMEEALAFLEEFPVDVVLADINLPGKSGIEVTREIKNLHPSIQVLALTMHEELEMVKKMVEAGATGFLLKRANMNEVLDAIRTVARKEKYLGRDIQGMMMDNLYKSETEMQAGKQEKVKLTPREKEILSLVAKEFTNEQIANKLFISERTVETHRRNIFSKTKTKSIVGLIKYAIHHGLITETNDLGNNSSGE